MKDLIERAVPGSRPGSQAPDGGAGSRTLDSLLRMLHAVREHLGMEVAFISEFTDGRRVFRHVDPPAPACGVRAGGSDPLEESYCQRVVDGRLPELMHDACTHPEALRLPVTRALPVGAHLSVPIRLSDGRVYGTVCCFSGSPDPTLNQRDLSMMRVFSGLVAEQVEQELAEQGARDEMAARLNAALRPGAMHCVLQPIFNITENRLVGVEALTRFDCEPRRPPDHWFREAALAGRGIELELHAIDLALHTLEALPPEVYIAVNASPMTIMDPRLATVLARRPLQRIVLEVTEHEEVEDYSGIALRVDPLRRAGLRMAVDDAGAGYACFRHVLRLAPDIIKLDVSITRDIDVDKSRQALAVALNHFADETHGRLVAEGVETLDELQRLRTLGVCLAQGYLLGRPGPLAQALGARGVPPHEAAGP